jgi:hypothetical protein
MSRLTLDIIIVKRLGSVIELLEVPLYRVGTEGTPTVKLCFRHYVI